MSSNPTCNPLAWPTGWKRTAEGHVEIQLQDWAGVAMVDVEDATWLMNFTWYAHRQGTNVYARTDVHAEGRKKTFMMHRLIMGARPGQIVDHSGGNGLDNRRDMLRFASVSQNTANSSGKTRVHSGFKGVTLDKRRISRPWTAQITKNYRHINIGSFEEELTAAAAYDLMAQHLHGQFARLNLGVLVLQQDASGRWVSAINQARDEALQEIAS